MDKQLTAKLHVIFYQPLLTNRSSMERSANSCNTMTEQLQLTTCQSHWAPDPTVEFHPEHGCSLNDPNHIVWQHYTSAKTGTIVMYKPTVLMHNTASAYRYICTYYYIYDADPAKMSWRQPNTDEELYRPVADLVISDLWERIDGIYSQDADQHSWTFSIATSDPLIILLLLLLYCTSFH